MEKLNRSLQEVRGTVQQRRADSQAQTSQGDIIKALMAAKAKGEIPGILGRLGKQLQAATLVLFSLNITGTLVVMKALMAAKASVEIASILGSLGKQHQPVSLDTPAVGSGHRTTFAAHAGIIARQVRFKCCLALPAFAN